jgi:hypothetical protein
VFPCRKTIPGCDFGLFTVFLPGAVYLSCLAIVHSDDFSWQSTFSSFCCQPKKSM